MTLEVLATVHNSGGKTTTVYVTIAKQMLSFMENLMDLANVVLKVLTMIFFLLLIMSIS